MNKLYFIIFFSILKIDAQALHHQMLSAQGASVVMPSGMVITQTIGQSTVIGVLTGGYIGGQGFQQQALVAKTSNSISNPVTTNLSVFPNPFSTSITVVVPTSFKDSILPVQLFDMQGRLIYAGNCQVQSHVITLELGTLPNAMYLLSIHTKTINYSTKIIKQ
ncbi:T9SS type A sorting domain-containing protein [Flavobacterium sp.]|uniref:T9SS type A sorting domain-containing protein n=1 Tax=Flavobacterium sp. TaxID=239 RepID=UPI00286F815D|nr:T9SS type A sorting domain-containing protein [Flavobacterium sp.]